MSTVTVTVDLAKNVFEIAVAGRAGTITERSRLRVPFPQDQEDRFSRPVACRDVAPQTPIRHHPRHFPAATF
jgi:hypothetical protein